MVIWTDWLTSVALALGTTPTEAGIMFSLAFTIGILLVVILATKGKKPDVTITFTSLFVTVFFTFIGWYPIWIGSVLALVLSIIIAKIISGGF